MGSQVYITGMAALSGYGLGLADISQGLAARPAWQRVMAKHAKARFVPCGQIPDFKEALAPYAKPLLRRKMSRLSKMAVTAVGDALAASGLLAEDCQDCGVVLGTAFGSTAQSDLFFDDFLGKGALKVNPGLFPETVPNAPAGQISIIFGLQGPNTTVCQQSLSSEHALALAFDLLSDGMATRLVVVGVEEMSPALLGGLQACGQLQNWPAAAGDEIVLAHRLRVGEASVALVLESEKSVEARQARPLARLEGVATAGAAAWPAVYHQVGQAVERAVATLGTAACLQAEAVVAGTSFIDDVDSSHLAALAALLGPELPTILPEYGTGCLMGAGLLRVVLAAQLVSGGGLPSRSLGQPLPGQFPYANLYTGQVTAASRVLTSAVSAGGGAGTVLVDRV